MNNTLRKQLEQKRKERMEVLGNLIVSLEQNHSKLLKTKTVDTILKTLSKNQTNRHFEILKDRRVGSYYYYQVKCQIIVCDFSIHTTNLLKTEKSINDLREKFISIYRLEEDREIKIKNPIQTELY